LYIMYGCHFLLKMTYLLTYLLTYIHDHAP